MIAAIDARHQRAEFAVGGFPSSQHDFMPGPAFRLGPILGAAGAIGCAEFLGDDTLQPQLARRLQNVIAVVLEMSDIVDQFRFAPGPRVEQLLQFRFALGERERANIHATRE
jgi:hypothetical protein